MDEDELAPSKSAVKRAMTALQELGEQLVGLSDTELARMPIENEQLAEAIAQARSIRSHSARRRQLQYIGKLMRKIDPQLLHTALAQLHQQNRQQVDAFHELEALRDRVLAEGAAGIEQVIEHYPHADRQHLRQLLRAHQKESAGNKAPAASRKIFKYLRELAEES